MASKVRKEVLKIW